MCLGLTDKPLDYNDVWPGQKPPAPLEAPEGGLCRPTHYGLLAKALGVYPNQPERLCPCICRCRVRHMPDTGALPVAREDVRWRMP